MTDKSTENIQKSTCPEWAETQIAQLREVEIYLGNIPKTAEWKSSHLNEIARRSLSSEHSSINEQTSELVFTKIVRSLHHDGFTSAQIESFINDRVSYQGGPKYCDRSEIEDAL